MTRPNIESIFKYYPNVYIPDVLDLAQYALELEKEVKDLRSELHGVYCHSGCPVCCPEDFTESK